MIEKTLVILKPDSVQRALVGTIISRFENVGLKIIGMKMVDTTEDLAEKHYKLTESWVSNLAKKNREAYKKKGIKLKDTDMEIAKRVQSTLKRYLSMGPVIAFVLEGPHAVEIVRKMVGGTEPRTSPSGTIRGDYMVDSYMRADEGKRAVKNLIHASGTVEEAEYEISLWFQPHELHEYETVHEKHVRE